MNITSTRFSPLVRICFFFVICASLLGSARCAYRSTVADYNQNEIVIPMPKSGPRRPKLNDYLCSATTLPQDERYIIEYIPRADPRVVHHMLLFGCTTPGHHSSWDCKAYGDICGGPEEEPEVIYAWALNASGTNLPEGVGYKVGQYTNIKSLVLQIHFSHVEDISDWSEVSQEALALRTTQQRPDFVAGIFLLGAGSRIAAGKKAAYVDAACRFQGPKTIYPFAFRTHAHSLGKQIVGYVVKPGGKWKVIGTRSPQDPQAFYPVDDFLAIEVSDMLAARCVYNTEDKHFSVYMGPDSEDEMCNFYIMYFTRNDGKHLYQEDCWSDPPSYLHFPAKLPPLSTHATPSEEEDHHSHSHSHMRRPSSTVPTESSEPPVNVKSGEQPVVPISEELPSIPTDEPTVASHNLVLAEDWPYNDLVLPEHGFGQVSAAAIDADGNLHVLHRGPVTWDFDSFRDDYVYNNILDGPINKHLIFKFSVNGTPVRAWGDKVFYMPHGLTIDHHGSVWVTDVALHQVMKFNKVGDKRPTLILGKAFHPGRDLKSFCQPSSVAVEQSGAFYVTDGYCNSRVMKFSPTGRVLHVWNAPVAGTSLFIPHKAILDETKKILYVADRENHRIITYDVSTTSSHGKVFSPDMGGAPYAITFNSSLSSSVLWPMYGVFGGDSHEGKLTGFTLDKQGTSAGSWGPEKGFDNPHDLVLDPVHNAVYVTEIGPNRIWKFVIASSTSSDLTSDLDDNLNSDILDDTLDSLSSSSAPRPAVDTPQTSKPLPQSTPHRSQEQLPQPSSSTHDKENLATDSNSTNLEESQLENDLDSFVNISNVQPDEEAQKKKHAQQSNVNIGVVVTVVAVGALAIIIAVGVAKEYRNLKFKGWRFIHGDRDSTIGVKPSGSTVKREKKSKKKHKKKKKKMTPYSKLQSVLGPSKLGFSRLKTYDSDSEEEEFPVFNRV